MCDAAMDKPLRHHSSVLSLRPLYCGCQLCLQTAPVEGGAYTSWPPPFRLRLAYVREAVLRPQALCPVVHFSSAMVPAGPLGRRQQGISKGRADCETKPARLWPCMQPLCSRAALQRSEAGARAKPRDGAARHATAPRPCRQPGEPSAAKQTDRGGKRPCANRRAQLGPGPARKTPQHATRSRPRARRCV